MAQAPQQNFNVSINKMAAMLPMMSDAELAQLTKSPQFGALALTEVAKRDRINTMQAAAGAPGGNIRDALLAKMAADDRFGLNNIVSQAEQGAIDFGGQEPEMAPPMMAAGGGMIAFEDGGQVKRYPVGGLVLQGITRAAPYVGRAVGRGIAGLRNRPLLYGSALATPFGFLGGEEGPEGPPVSDVYPEEFDRGARTEADIAEAAAVRKEAEAAASGKKSEKQAAEGIANLLGKGTSASDILKERRQLEKEAGLGEYGADVKDKQAKRRAEAEEKFGKEKEVQAFLGAAKAAGAGGKRLSGLGALAAAVSGGGEGALEVMKEERSALDKLADAEEKMAMAEDLYKRGDIASAQKMAAEATQQQQENALKLRQIQSTEAYQGMMARAAIARASQTTGVKPGDAINAIKEANNLRQRMSMLDPKDPVAAAEIQAIQQQLQMLKLLAGAGTMRGAGISIEDVPDET